MRILSYIVFSLTFIFSTNSLKSQNKKQASELLNHIELNIFSTQLQYDLTLDIVKKDKVIKHYKMKTYKKGKKLRIEFVEPPVEEGRRMLNDGENFWMYLPRSSKLIRLPANQSFMGSNASNRDIMRISYIDDYLIDSVYFQKKESDTLVIELKANNLAISYNKLALYVERNQKIPLKQEFFSLSGKLLKEMVFSDFKKVGSFLFPQKVTIIDYLNKETTTILWFDNIVRDGTFTDSFFTIGSLKQ